MDKYGDRARRTAREMVERTVAAHDRVTETSGQREIDEAIEEMGEAWGKFVDSQHDLNEAADAVVAAYQTSDYMPDIVQSKIRAAQEIRGMLGTVQKLGSKVRTAAGQLMRV